MIVISIGKAGEVTSDMYDSSHIHRKGKFGIEKGQSYRILMRGEIENHTDEIAHKFPQKTRAIPG